VDSAAQIAELGKFTSGWVARYEIWDIEHDIRLVNRYDIPLEEAEVTLQIQQFRAFTWTVHKCREKKLQLRFPTSISSNINILSICSNLKILRQVNFLREASKQVLHAWATNIAFNSAKANGIYCIGMPWAWIFCPTEGLLYQRRLQSSS
jgi:hypothetical protein